MPESDPRLVKLLEFDDPDRHFLLVWVGLARFDPVGYSEWHGPNPHGKGFGATRFHTGDISGHSSYFNEGSESLRNIGLIAAGYLDDVNVNDGFF